MITDLRSLPEHRCLYSLPNPYNSLYIITVTKRKQIQNLDPRNLTTGACFTRALINEYGCVKPLTSGT